MSIQDLWNGTDSPAPANATQGDDGSTTLRLADGTKFRIQPPPPAITGPSTPRRLVTEAVGVLNELSLKTHSARTDPNLSDTGRQTALASVQSLALFTMGQLWVELTKFRSTIDQRETRLYAVAEPNLANAGAAIRAWECREYFAKLDMQEKTAMLSRIRTDTGRVVELVTALLTAPYAMADVETEMIKSLWQTARREQNATEAEAIDADREAADWAAGQLGVFGRAVMQLASTWGPIDIAAKFAALKTRESGYEVFGLTERDMSKAERQSVATA